MRLKIDLHVHTNYSYDSLITPKELVYYAKNRGLDGVAVTDHFRIDGALKIASETDFLIIPGIEVESRKGHILGLNVGELIPSKLGVDETVDKIHDAGGIAVACHPVTFFKGSLGENTTARFDAVEVINSRAFPFRYSVKHGQLLASRLRIPSVAGSDAHYGPEIGHAYTIVDAEPRVDEIAEAISKGLCQPFGKPTPFTTTLKREILIIKRNFNYRKRETKED